MLTYKKVTAEIFAFLLTSVIFSTFLFGAEMPKMPSMPELSSMPEVPEISNPSLDTEFYTPGVPYTPFSKKNEQKKNVNSEDRTSVLKDGTTSTDLLSSLLSNDDTLTASDISLLYDSGKFSDISSLSGNVTANSTNILLQQVLLSLDELKAEQKKATPAEKQIQEQYVQDSQNFKNRVPSILRFKINGYNLKDSLTTVFFSEPEFDGSFLLTADRKYFVNQKQRTETFYLLFKASDSNGSTVTYKVQPSIVQDYKNETSFVYRMVQKKNLKAERTGNLVSLRSTDGLNIDILLDIDKR